MATVQNCTLSERTNHYSHVNAKGNNREQLRNRRRIALYTPSHLSFCRMYPGGQIHLNEPSKFWHVPGEHFPGSSAHSLISRRRERHFVGGNCCYLNKSLTVTTLVLIPSN